MEARCQCGAVSFTTSLAQPLALYICHCEACQRQTSSAFGASAIFPRFKIPRGDLLSCYTAYSLICRDDSRPTASGQTLYCYFCRQCGTRLLHATPSKNVVSVKGGCLEGLNWSKAIHLWTKSAMVPIPEGAETYAESSPMTAYSHSSEQESLDQPGHDLIE